VVGLNTGYDRTLEQRYLAPKSILPNRWLGESGCLIGPFSCQEVAEHFANVQVDFGQYESYAERVLLIRGSWYVEVKEASIAQGA
jgi:hypothetical protein